MSQEQEGQERINTLLYLDVEEQLRRVATRYGELTKQVALAIEGAVELKGKDLETFDTIVDGLFGRRRRFGFIIDQKLSWKMRSTAFGMDMSLIDFVNASIRFRLLKIGVITPSEAGTSLESK